MGFASTFMTAWVNGLVRRGRFFLGMVGVISAAGGAWSMYSAAVHSANGVNTTAVLVDRFARCQAEFQPKGESRRKVAMDCARAYAFRDVVGSKKVKVHRTDHATVRYTPSDGTSRTATVFEGKGGTRGLAVGGQFDAVYDPANPDDVRAQPTLSSVGFHLAMLLGGLVMVGLAFLRQVLGLFASSDKANAKTADAAAWGEDALKDAIALRQSVPQRVSAASGGNGFGKAASTTGPRRQFGVRGA